MTKKLTISPKIWQLIPELEVGVITSDHFDRKDSIPENLLIEANKKALKWVSADPISANPIIKSWRQTFQKFKTQKGARCSVENLLKRAKQGKAVQSINGLVDVYNSVSLETAFPMGGFDLDQINGNLELFVEQQNENFWPIGEKEPEKTLVGEIIYRDDTAVLTRCLNWRDGITSELTDETQNVIFLIENNCPERHQDFKGAIKLLQNRLSDFLNLKTKSQILNPKSNSCNLI
ncbi:MAG: phenylalanine--tRNA ligase beta subunit-related protein [Bombilactobacillus mellifer]|nr:phenylalanine--tRNA ligase beta subunit-related protein [Bombilactobacillus mellifer]